LHSERGTIDKDDKKLFLYRASVDDKSSSPSDAGSDQKVKMEGLAQRVIGSENIDNRLLTQIKEPPPMNGREYYYFRSRYVPAKQSTSRYEAVSLIAIEGKATRERTCRATKRRRCAEQCKGGRCSRHK
jgi:hypothetical protein